MAKNKKNTNELVLVPEWNKPVSGVVDGWRPQKLPKSKPSALNTKKRTTGTRYSEEERIRVVRYVESIGKHGAIKAAIKKFGVSYIALRVWLQKYGRNSGGTYKQPSKAVNLKTLTGSLSVKDPSKNPRPIIKEVNSMILALIKIRRNLKGLK